MYFLLLLTEVHFWGYFLLAIK